MSAKMLIAFAVACLNASLNSLPARAAQGEPATRNAALEYWPNWYALEHRDDDELVQVAHEFGSGLWEARRTGPHQPNPTPEGLEPESDLAVWLEDIQSLLDNLGTASEARACDFGLRRQDGWDMQIIHASPMRRWYRVLAVDARRHTDAGRPDAAALRIATIIRMGEHLTQSGDAMSQLLAVSAVSHAATEGQWLMSKGISTAGRTILLDAIDRFDKSDPFQSAAVLRNLKADAATAPVWLRNGGLAKMLESLQMLDMAREGVPPEDAELDDTQLLVALAERYLSDDPEQEAVKIQRAWDAVIDAWTQPSAREHLRAIEQRTRDGEFGPAAQMMGPLSVAGLWQTDQQGRLTLAALRALIEPKADEAADGG